MIEFVAGVAVGFCLTVVAGAIISKFNQHEHTLEPRSLTAMIRTHRGGGKTDITEVLYICSCGYAETKEYTGSWKLEDFQVTSTKGKDKELESLRKMAGIPSEEGK